MTEEQFAAFFEELTGNAHMKWQWRLFQKFEAGKFPSVIDLPTGLGKTMVMALWLIAWARNKSVPRRLVYVVDRRTVVDHATDLATILKTNAPAALPCIANLAVSTLRGQLADNREWSRDMSAPAVIIGTVDLIGSALLFSGYRSSYKRRPLEAGLLGQDSLLVLDEAHLSRPFEKLLTSVAEFQADTESRMRVIRMSATSAQCTHAPTFTLQFDGNGELDRDDAKDAVVATRLEARKTLTVIPLNKNDDLNTRLAYEAIQLAQDPEVKGKRIVVFVRSPEDAKTIAERIRSHAKPAKSKSNPDPKGPYADAVEVLTGAMRGFERDTLVEKPVFKDRWLQGDLDPSGTTNQQPVFLVSTSAGEVGFDLNADHLVGDAAPLDSWIQRLGRVNRRGGGDARVILLTEHAPADKTDYDKARIAASKLLDDASKKLDVGMPVSPKALAAFKQALTSEQIDSASTPKPAMVELTDILLDAWSMTSITEPMPGRPDVAPWLRGIANELPQTTIAWRVELDFFKDVPNPKKVFKSIFVKHPIRPHESLTTNSYRVVEFLKAATAEKKGRPELRDTLVVVKFSRELMVTSIGKLIDDAGPLNADPTLILPPSFGGLDQSGMLSHEAIPRSYEPGQTIAHSLDVADKQGYEPWENRRPRLRLLINRSDGGWIVSPLPGGKPIPADLNLTTAYDDSKLLFKAISETDLRVRLVQQVSCDAEDLPDCSVVFLSPVVNQPPHNEEPLDEHVGKVEQQAQRLIAALGIRDPFAGALLFAAKWHDEGKKADIWQRYIGRQPGGPLLGKSATARDPQLLLGYRHEFGSLLRVCGRHRHPANCELPKDADMRELALHLIATHHGFGRPHFDNPTDRDCQTKQCEAVHTDVIRRFAHLQRKYGWWRLAWLENLLRCADALASADPDADDLSEPTDEVGGGY